MNVPFKGVIVALSAATLFACGGTEEPDPGSQTQEVKCAGINSCKGQSDCSGATNDCAGLNDCKGQGYLLTPTAAECTDKGGKVI